MFFSSQVLHENIVKGLVCGPYESTAGTRGSLVLEKEVSIPPRLAQFRELFFRCRTPWNKTFS